MFFCCCTPPPNCDIDSDDFNRPDTTDMSPKWREYELGGYNGWQIVGNKLAFGSGYLEFTAEDPETTDGIRWSAKFNFGGQTGGFQLQVDRIDDSSFHFAEVICTGENEATLRVWRQEAGSPEALSSAVPIAGFNWSSDHELAVCWGLLGITPECSHGSVGWVWTLDYLPDGSPGWQPRTTTGECNSAYATFCTSEPPETTGMELEGDTASTSCIPIFGGEGQPVNAISATVDNGVQVSAPTEPHGGVKVAVYRSGGGSNFRIDDAKLELLQDGCPDCEGTGVPCETPCIDGKAPKYIGVAVSDVASSGEPGENCVGEMFNRTFIVESDRFVAGDAILYCSSVSPPEGFVARCGWLVDVPAGPGFICGSTVAGEHDHFAASIGIGHVGGKVAVEGALHVGVVHINLPIPILTLRFRAVFDEIDEEENAVDCLTFFDGMELPALCWWSFASGAFSVDMTNAKMELFNV